MEGGGGLGERGDIVTHLFIFFGKGVGFSTALTKGARPRIVVRDYVLQYSEQEDKGSVCLMMKMFLLLYSSSYFSFPLTTDKFLLEGGKNGALVPGLLTDEFLVFLEQRYAAGVGRGGAGKEEKGVLSYFFFLLERWERIEGARNQRLDQFVIRTNRFAWISLYKLHDSNQV